MKTKYWLIIMLSLLNAGVAWAVTNVESRHAKHNRLTVNEENAALNTLSRLEFLQNEIQELRGKVEEQSYQLQQMQEHQKKLYAELDRLREGAKQNSGSSGILLEEEPDRPLQNTANTVQANEGVSYQDEEKAYLAAYRLIQNKDYDGALSAFKTLIMQSPQGKYTPNAQYWLGEIYLAKGNFAQAMEAFNIVYQQYPQHPKAADSLLKLGYVEYAKGQWKRAGDLLKQVKDQFPGSTSAQLADARLQKMQHEGHL